MHYLVSVVLHEKTMTEQTKLDPVADYVSEICYSCWKGCDSITVRDISGYRPHTFGSICCFNYFTWTKITSQLTTAMWLHYNAVLLLIPNITVKGRTVLNPATLLPIPGKLKGQHCVVTITEVCCPKPDLQKTPLQSSDLELFTQISITQPRHREKSSWLLW